MTGNNTQGKIDFAGRKTVFRWDGAAASLQFWDQSAGAQPPGKLRIAPPFSDPSTKPTYPLGPGQMGFSALKQASPDRIREVLRILNFLAAPFGTQEHLLINYGVPGVHHTPDADRIRSVVDLEASGGAHHDIRDLLGDVVAIEHEIVRGLAKAGCVHVQIDGPSYTRFVDPEWLAEMRVAGQDPMAVLQESIQADNAVIAGVEGVIFGMHLCRGNPSDAG